MEDSITDCWEDCWYPALQVGPNGYTRLHRLMYQTFKGDIPERWQVDHLCRNRACCNPEHLEAVTINENASRREKFMASTGQKRGYTHNIGELAGVSIPNKDVAKGTSAEPKVAEFLTFVNGMNRGQI